MRTSISILAAAILGLGLIGCQARAAAPTATPTPNKTQAERSAHVRVPPPPHLEDPKQCHAYEPSEHPDQILKAVRSRLSLWMPKAAWALYDQFLTPGSGSSSRLEVPDSAQTAFRDSSDTAAALRKVLNKVVEKLQKTRPLLTSPDAPVGGTLTGLGVGENLEISWFHVDIPMTVPALIAGGTGGVESQASGTSVANSRRITGRYYLRPKATENGVLETVTLKATGLQLDVNDSINFCPGNLGQLDLHKYKLGKWPVGAWLGDTLKMSRLERTPYGDGSYANPVLWHLRTSLPDNTVKVTGLYPRNDPDNDGWPDTQPWRGASYRLDNCPGVSNPGQADSIGDGVGDACRKPSPSTTAPPDNSVPPDNYYPQIISFTASAPQTCTESQPNYVTLHWSTTHANGVDVDIDHKSVATGLDPNTSTSFPIECTGLGTTILIAATSPSGEVPDVDTKVVFQTPY